MPHLDEFHQANVNNDYVVIAISAMEDMKTVQEYIEKEGYTFPVLLDENAAVAYQYQVRYTPTTYFINKEGTIVDTMIGPLDFSQLKDKF